MLATTVKAYLVGTGKASAWQPRKPHGHFLPKAAAQSELLVANG